MEGLASVPKEKGKEKCEEDKSIDMRVEKFLMHPEFYLSMAGVHNGSNNKPINP